MRKSVDATPSRMFGGWLAATALMFVLGAAVCPAATDYTCPMSPTTTISQPSWGGNEAYQGILNWNNYFYSGQTSTQNSSLALYSGEAGYNQSNGNGYNFGVIFDWSTDNSGFQTTYSGQSGGGSPNNNPYWGTFYVEGEDLETAVNAYWWAKAHNGDKAKYLAEVNNIAQGIIDEMWPVSNFYSNHTPWQSGYSGDALKWYGTGYTDTNYQSSERAHDGGGGDWFNDDLMWLAIAFEGAFDVTKDAGTPVLGWRYVTQNMVDYVYANAQAKVSTDGTEVGLMQTFCNANNTKDGGCVYDPVHHLYTGSSWYPNMGAVPNFSFVIAARMLANDLTEQFPNGTYNTEAANVWKYAMNNIIDFDPTGGNPFVNACNSTMSQYASAFGSLSTTQSCAELIGANTAYIIENGTQSNLGYNGEGGYWSGITAPGPSSGWDTVMNYGVAIKAAILMGYYHGNPNGYPDVAQEVANYLMYGISNSNWPYSGTVTYGTSGIPYNILPYYGSSGGSNNNSEQAGIALRDVAFGLSSNVGELSVSVLDGLTLNWAQVNVQAAWNNKNNNNVTFNNWCQSPQAITPASSSGATFYSADDSAAAAGMMTVPGTY